MNDNKSLLTVQCLTLTDPDNGIIDCPLRDGGVSSYEDTCRFTCNTGYELTGSETRTCQSDGSWSGTDDVCRRSMIACTIDSIVTVYVHAYMHTVCFSS